MPPACILPLRLSNAPRLYIATATLTASLMFYSQPVPGPLPQAFSKEPLHRYNVIFDTEELVRRKHVKAMMKE